MTIAYDALETRPQAERDAAHMAALPRQVAHAQQHSPAFAGILQGVSPTAHREAETAKAHRG